MNVEACLEAGGTQNRHPRRLEESRCPSHVAGISNQNYMPPFALPCKTRDSYGLIMSNTNRPYFINGIRET